MQNICIIAVYFGSLPSYFQLWLESCKFNNTIDYILVTDQPINGTPSNVYVKNMIFSEFKDLVQTKFDFLISLERPYKICDYKPAYGIIFNSYLKEYDFWGHCDLDMIFGNLRRFITHDLLNKYDKIYNLGHLSLYRNTSRNNLRFMIRGSSDVGDFTTVYTNNKSFYFDEIFGICQIYKKNSFSIYENRDYADISSIYSRFRLALKDTNYKNQIFTFEDGNIFREYFENRNYGKDEFAYLHIKKPKSLQINFDTSSGITKYYITNKGFYQKTNNTTIADIMKYNKYKGYIYEKAELYNLLIRRKIKSIIKKNVLKIER